MARGPVAFDPRQPFSVEGGFDPSRPYEVERETAGFDPSQPFTVEPPLRRSPMERFGENLKDAWERSGAGRMNRQADPTGNGFDLGDIWQAPRIRSGSPVDTGLDALFGDRRGFLRGTTALTPAEQQERDRRAQYEARALADPIKGMGDRAAYLGGQIAGAALSPESWINPGPALAGRTGARLAGAIGQRAAGNAGANIALDATMQGADVMGGVQERYSPTQTAMSGVAGAVIGGSIDAAGVGAGRASQLPRRAAAALDGRIRNPVPDFGAGMDTGPVPQGSPGRGATAARGPVRRPPVASGASPAVQRAISGAAEAYGVPLDFMDALARRESSYNPNARADTSSATGLYQFTDGTWLETVRRHGRALGIPDAAARPDADLLRLRTDADLNARAAAVHTRDNAAALRGVLGRDPTNGELYAAHFAGRGGARQLLTANPDARAADILPEAARSNRSIFYDGNRPRSVAEVMQGFEQSFSGRSGVVAGAPPRPSRPGVPMDEPGAAPQTFGRLEPIGRSRPDYAALAAQDLRGSASPGMMTAPRDMPATGRVTDGGFDPSRPFTIERASPDLEFARITRDVAPVMRPEFLRQYAPAREGFDVPAMPARDVSAGFARASDGGFDPSRPFEIERPALRQDVPTFGQGFDPSRPFTIERAAGPSEPVSFAGRIGQFDPSRPFTLERPGVLAMGQGSRLPVDLSAYGSRVGAPSGPQTGPVSNIGGISDALRPGAVPRGQGGEYAGQSVSSLARDLRNTLGITQRQGRPGVRGALGTYDTGSGVVRTKAVQELDVLAHEATHALEYERSGPALQAALRQYEAEITPMAYAGAKPGALRQEGFAEFGRLYLTNPQVAQSRAPNFYRAFEAAMSADNPRAAEQLRGIQSAYADLLRADSIEVAKGSLAYTGRKGPIGETVRDIREQGLGSVIRRTMSRLYTALIDDKNPLKDAVNDLSRLFLENSGRKLELRPSKNPYILARLTPDANAAGLNDVLHGVTPYRGLDPEGPALADALETAGIKAGPLGFNKDALQEFDVYLIARRMVNEWDRFARGELPNPPDKNTRQFHEQVIADAEALNPSYRDAAGQVYEWLDNLWRKEFEAGLITRDAYENGLTAHPDYVPLMRDVADKGGRSGKPRGALQFAGGVDAFEGSTRDVRSPLSVMMQRAYALNGIIKRNDVLKALDDLGQAAGPGAGAIVERLPAKEIQGFTVNAADALRKTADELGLSGRDLTTIQKVADDAANEDAVVQMFRQTEFSPRKGEQVVFVWRNGEKTPLLLPDGEAGKDLFDALTGMNKEVQNIAVDMMAAGTAILRQGVTLSPEFAVANLIRDSLSTWINSGTSFKPGLGTVIGGAEALRGGRDAIRYGSVGGLRGGANVAAFAKAIPMNDTEALRQLQVLDRKGLRVRRAATNPLRALAEVTDFSETATRLGVFKAGFNDAKRAGLNDYDALIQSGFLARDYMDFGRRGSKMVAASRIVTFLNAALQGLDKTTRVLSADGGLHRALAPLLGQPTTAAERAAYSHAAKAWAKVAMLGALGLSLRMLYADDPEYQEIGDQLRATHWIVRHEGSWVFIPKPFELAALSNILERSYEGFVLKDPTAPERLLSDMLHTVAPPTEVPTLAVPFQIARNRDHLGRPIVPDHLRGTVDPAYQFNAYTSDLGKLIGRTFNVPPAVVDHVVTGIGGSLGRYVLQGSNLIGEEVTGRPRTASGPEDMFLMRRFVKSPARGATSQAEFWDQISKDGGEMTRAEGTYRALIRDGKDAEAVTYLRGLPAQERAVIAAKTMLPEGMSVIHPLVRTQKAVAVLSDFRRDVRSGDLRDERGQVIPLTPQDRRAIDNALADMAVANMRSALTDTGIRGWEQRDALDPMRAAATLERTNPAAYNQLRTRMMLERVPHEVLPGSVEAATAMWRQLRPMLEEQPDPERLLQFIRQRRFMTGDRSDKYQERQRLIGGAYAQ